MVINMLLKIRAEPEIDRDCWEIERLSINIWQIDDEKSLIDYGFDIKIRPKENNQSEKNFQKNNIEIHEIALYVPYKVEKVDDITESCYGSHKIGKIIFKNFRIEKREYKGPEYKKFEIVADSEERYIVICPLYFPNSEYNPAKMQSKSKTKFHVSEIYIILNEPIKPGETRSFRIRVTANGVPIKKSWLPWIHREFIYDIRIYDNRAYPDIFSCGFLTDDFRSPDINKLFVFVIPKSNLEEKRILSNLDGNASIRLLETEIWNEYLKITGHEVEDGRKVYGWSYIRKKEYNNTNNKYNNGPKPVVRLYLEFEDPYSKVLSKIFLTSIILYTSTLPFFVKYSDVIVGYITKTTLLIVGYVVGAISTIALSIMGDALYEKLKILYKKYKVSESKERLKNELTK